MSEDQNVIAQLKSQIKDLEQSLKINKELMQNVLMGVGSDDSLKQVIQKLEEENNRLSQALHKEHKEKVYLYETTKKCKEQMDKDHELLKDKEHKFEIYLQKCRQDLDERNRTIDQQAKAIEKLRPIVERFEKEMETKEEGSSFRETETEQKEKTLENNRQNSASSMESVEVEVIVNENEKLAKDLKKANDEIDRLRNNL